MSDLLSNGPVFQYLNGTSEATVALICAYEEYIKLLGEELSDMSTIASLHHWSSTRVEVGKRCRKAIAKSKENLINAINCK